jgi:hypothetical protein
MEDDLNKNGRRPKKKRKTEDDLKRNKKMEDDLKRKKKMEDNLKHNIKSTSIDCDIIVK